MSHPEFGKAACEWNASKNAGLRLWASCLFSRQLTMRKPLLIFALALCTLTVEAGLSGSEEIAVSKASRHEKAGWIYLHIEGAPHERGFQHGYLLAPEIQESLRITRAVWEYQSGMDWKWLLKKSSKLLNPKIDPEWIQEMGGIVSGLKAAGVTSSLDEIVAYNAIIELSNYWWPKEKRKYDYNSPTSPKDACSAFIATGSATADGGVVMGHNTMSGYTDAYYNVILDILPNKGHRILMQGQPGWIHSGTDFFITDAGLLGTETTIGDFHGFDEKGVPEFVRMRKATQYGHSIDTWCDLMRKGNNGGYANAWLLGDINTKEIARLEQGLKHTALEKKTEGFFVGSNVAEDRKVLRFDTSEEEQDIRSSSVARRVRWKELMKANHGRVNAELAKQFEADHYDTFLKQERLGARGLCAHGEFEADPRGRVPFRPSGTTDAKVVDSQMAAEMSFAARWGSACGTPFDAPTFLTEHPQYEWMSGLIRSRPAQPWVMFKAGEK